uniref:Transmembrane protein n=1 Tax=Heterorhabditis bacteriophora TaxID=37862 RepID=A0A1I7WR89_HETBA
MQVFRTYFYAAFKTLFKLLIIRLANSFRFNNILSLGGQRISEKKVSLMNNNDSILFKISYINIKQSNSIYRIDLRLQKYFYILQRNRFSLFLFYILRTLNNDKFMNLMKIF